jgi:hypothetical protein
VTGSSSTEPSAVAPWRCEGWRAGAVERIDARLGAAGLSRTGPVTQVRAWALSAVLRCGTTDGPVFYKEAVPSLRHEGRVLAHLGARQAASARAAASAAVPSLAAPSLAVPSRAAPVSAGAVEAGLVPAVLGAEVPGPGWCTRGVDVRPGTELPERERAAALRALVPIQLGLLGREAELTAIGCWDRTAAALRPGLAHRTDLFGPGRELPDAFSREEAARWSQGAERLAGLCRELADAPPGNTLVHGDLHPGNWGVDRRSGRLMLFDWAEAAVGHPFLDVVAALRSAVDPAVHRWARERYFQAWSPLLSAADCADVWRLAEPVAVLNQIVTYVRFFDESGPLERQGWTQRILWWARRLLHVLAGLGGPGRDPR